MRAKKKSLTWKWPKLNVYIHYKSSHCVTTLCQCMPINIYMRLLNFCIEAQNVIYLYDGESCI